MKTSYIYTYKILTRSGYKYYVGSTTLKVTKRAGSNYSGYKNQPKFYNCLRKYPNNIKVIIKEYNNITKKELQAIEQFWLDEILKETGKFPYWCLNMSPNSSGGKTLKNYGKAFKKACLAGRTLEEHSKAIIDGGGFAPKPITVWNSETREIIFEANSTYCKNLQEFLGKEQSHISCLLNRNNYSLVRKSVNGVLVTLSYQDETLEQRIESSTRIFSEDLETARRLNIVNKVFVFYNNKTDETKTVKGYKTHSEIGRELNLKHPNMVSYLISGKLKTSEGWTLVKTTDSGAKY